MSIVQSTNAKTSTPYLAEFNAKSKYSLVSLLKNLLTHQDPDVAILKQQLDKDDLEREAFLNEFVMYLKSRNSFTNAVSQGYLKESLIEFLRDQSLRIVLIGLIQFEFNESVNVEQGRNFNPEEEEYDDNLLESCFLIAKQEMIDMGVTSLNDYCPYESQDILDLISEAR